MHNGEERGEPKIDLESLVWLLRGHDQLADACLDLAGKRAVPFLLFTSKCVEGEFYEVAPGLVTPHSYLR